MKEKYLTLVIGIHKVALPYEKGKCICCNCGLVLVGRRVGMEYVLHFDIYYNGKISKWGTLGVKCLWDCVPCEKKGGGGNWLLHLCEKVCTDRCAFITFVFAKLLKR